MIYSNLSFITKPKVKGGTLYEARNNIHKYTHIWLGLDLGQNCGITATRGHF